MCCTEIIMFKEQWETNWIIQPKFSRKKIIITIIYWTKFEEIKMYWWLFKQFKLKKVTFGAQKVVMVVNFDVLHCTKNIFQEEILLTPQLTVKLKQNQISFL
jgi:hypothetical protein